MKEKQSFATEHKLYPLAMFPIQLDVITALSSSTRLAVTSLTHIELLQRLTPNRREATDPVNLQPKIRPVFRRTASHLRNHPPENISSIDLDNALDSIEAPWGRRIEKHFRELLNLEETQPRVKSSMMITKIRELGLQPYIAPEPLPRIELEDIHLICWMILSKK